MKSSEIIVMVFAIGAGFFISLIVVDLSMIRAPFMRFWFRTIIQFVLFTLVYLTLDSADMSERLKEKEKRSGDSARISDSRGISGAADDMEG